MALYSQYISLDNHTVSWQNPTQKTKRRNLYHIPNEIQEKVLESFRLRKRVKDLLEYAKCAVEIAIEQDEQTAINWLDSVSYEIDI